MRIKINLATHPYEAAREYRRRITMLVAVLGVITAVLLGYIIEQRIVSRKINHQISEVEQQLADLDHEKAQAQVILNRPANRVVADQSRFLNDLFARKALSWTRVFTEMERIMPPYNIHVVSMKPDYSPDNQLLLHMVVATDSRDRAVELVQRMEKSSHFRQAQVVAENVLNTSGVGNQGTGGGNIQFDIAALYIPGPDDTKDIDTKDENGDQPNTGTKVTESKSGTATQAQNQRPEQGHH
jgi:type IV pilus assembly protein PilN